MPKPLVRAALLGAALTLPIAAVNAAAGTPQRSDEVPPGLAKVFAKAVPGIMKAIIASEGSNSRLQDLPVSP